MVIIERDGNIFFVNTAGDPESGSSVFLKDYCNIIQELVITSFTFYQSVALT